MISLEEILNNNKYTYFISESGLNHNGSVDIVKDLIRISKECGADAVKLQKRDVENLATREILDAADNRFPEFGSTYREVRQHLEFNHAQYLEIKEFCKETKIDFICTAFDIISAKFLINLGIDYFKVASHSLTHIQLLKFLSDEKIPSILSTGMSELEDIDLAHSIFKKNNVEHVFLHCVSSYPTPDNEVNIDIIDTLTNRYNVIIGYSGHEIGYFSTLIAVAKGARVVERHITLDKNMIGFDHSLSLEPEELKLLIEDIRKIETLRGTNIKRVTDVELFKKNQYNVSMIANQDISKGTILDESHFEFKNPGTGILYKDSKLVLGKKTNQSINKDTIIDIKMFD